MATRRLIQTIKGGVSDVFQQLGPYHREYVYQHSLAYFLEMEKIQHKIEHRCDFIYRGKKISHGKMDIYIPACEERQSNSLIIEVKSKELLVERDTGQLLKYMRATRTTTGLLINFVHDLENTIDFREVTLGAYEQGWPEFDLDIDYI